TTYPYTTPPHTALHTLSLHDALPICSRGRIPNGNQGNRRVDIRSLRQESQSGPSRRRRQRDWVDANHAMALCQHQSDRRVPCARSEEHTSELQSRFDLVCRLLLEKKK